MIDKPVRLAIPLAARCGSSGSRARTRRATRARRGAAAGPAPGSSGSRRAFLGRASRYVCDSVLVPAAGVLAERLASVERRRWRSISKAIARSTERNEFMFLTSTLRPERFACPGGATRRWPRRASGPPPCRRRWPRSREAAAAVPRRSGGPLGRVDVGVGDDLHERRAGAVEVDEADPRPAAPVHGSACGVLLEVGLVMPTVSGPSEVSMRAAARSAAGRTG